MGIAGGAGQAELATVHERQLMPVPGVLDWDAAGGVPETFTTAHDALFTQARLRAGERLLVSGAAGGVGTSGVQLGRAAGARVTATVRNHDHDAAIAELGAEQVLDPEGFEEHGPFDVVLELVGAPNIPGNLKALATTGRVVVIGVGAGVKAELDLRLLMRSRGRIMASTLRPRPLEEKALTARRLERHVLPLFETGALRVPIAETYPLAQARGGLRAVPGGRQARQDRAPYVGVLELDGLTRRYGDVVALDGLTFSVSPGQVFGFVGPNGAGKTTAMRIVLGVLSADAGDGPVGGQAGRRGPARQVRLHARGARAVPEDARRASSSPTSRGCTARTRDRGRSAAATGWSRSASRTARGRPRGAALARQPAARAARHGARPRPDRADPRRAVQRPGSGRRRRHERGARRRGARGRRAGAVLQPPARARRAPVRRRRDHQGRRPGGQRDGRRAARARRRPGLWRVEVQGAAPRLGRGRGRRRAQRGRRRRRSRRRPTSRRCSTRRAPPGASRASSPSPPTLAELFREAIAA